jgi:hypothetical protein
MGIGHPPQKRRSRLGTSNVVSLRNQGDEISDVLSPLLEEAATFPDGKSGRQGIHSVLSLLEENARLRALAVKLSNLIGDIPVQEWENAARS